jgi:glycosyltransferase involved in cell wall biosynthesis
MSESGPGITVYITNHNYGRYIKKAIESVLNQTYTDYEVIIIDDGSTDDSKTIIEQYESNPLINVVYQQKQGLTISNNIALKLARGKFIVRLDADDYLTKDALKLLYREFEDEQIGMVFGDWYLINEAGDVIGVEQRHNFENDVTLKDQPAHGACTMFRTRCLKELGGYDETITRQDGYELWLRFIDQYQVRNLNVPIFYYRQHSVSLTMDEVKLLDTRSEILNKHANRKNGGNNNRIVAIIPIRGNEIDHRSRPFAKIGGRYLLDRTIETVLQVDNISKVIVTTPDEKILEHIDRVYDREKVVSLKRPLEMARINTPSQETIDHSLEHNDTGKLFDYFFQFSIENPFKRKELIESAINIANIFDVDTVIGVRANAKKHFRHNGAGLQPINTNPEFLRLENQQLFTMASGFLLRRIDSYRNTKRILGENIGHVVFDRKAMFEIEDEVDVTLANAIA